MESHVNGPFVPMSLSELRQAICAVYLGNPRFTVEEHCQATHQAHESKDVQALSCWLQAARLLDAQRAQQARQQAADTLPQPGVCLNQATQHAELQGLLRCRAISKGSRFAYARLFAILAAHRHRSRLALLGNSYLEMLENAGKISQHLEFKILHNN
jgi:hypothetical protein